MGIIIVRFKIKTIRCALCEFKPSLIYIAIPGQPGLYGDPLTKKKRGGEGKKRKEGGMKGEGEKKKRNWKGGKYLKREPQFRERTLKSKDPLGRRSCFCCPNEPCLICVTLKPHKLNLSFLSHKSLHGDRVTNHNWVWQLFTGGFRGSSRLSRTEIYPQLICVLF